MRLFHRRRVVPADLRPVTAPASIPAAPAPSHAYTVTYDRVGDWGRGTLPAPAPLTVGAVTSAEIAAAIRMDVTSYLPAGASVFVIVDLGLLAGQLRANGQAAGTFSLHMHPGGGHR